MKVFKFGFIIPLFSVFLLNCKTAAQNSEILSIAFEHTYGRAGAIEILATSNSLLSKGRFDETPNFIKKINPKDWEKLKSGIDISVLKKTKSGLKQGHFDGPDQIFRIITSDKEYELYNVPKGTFGYEQLDKLKKYLENSVTKNK